MTREQTPVRRTGPRRQGFAHPRGAALIEFALISVLLFVLTFGVFHWGLVLYRYCAVSYLSREAARYAAVRGSTSGMTVTATDIAAFVQGSPVGYETTVSTTWTPDNTPGSRVIVEVATTTGLPIPFLPMSPITVRSTSQLIVIR